MNKTNYKRGDVLMINLGTVGTTEIRGHEQGNLRPCIVIKSLHNIKLLIVVPLTSKKPKHIAYFHVKINKGIAGLTLDSYVLCHHIRTISTDRILKKLGILPSIDLGKVQTVLLDLID